MKTVWTRIENQDDCGLYESVVAYYYKKTEQRYNLEHTADRKYEKKCR
jgi:hypothetical protein